MALKHIKLSELDDPFEFKTDDEEKDGGSKGIDESLKARRKANIEYQNTRKKQLEKIGRNHIQLRLDDESFEKLSDLCEVLGYKRPKPQMHNLVEMYSAIFKCLLRTSDESFGYSPTTSRSIKTLGVYKYVDHLSNEKNWSKDAILAELKNKGTKIYINKIGEKRGLSGNEKFLERFFDKNKILKLLTEMDDAV
ncbi:hypothetical protein DU121_01200 [Salmonella enterica subsp. salamae]|nr:hypothetical protein [Salmonella enterica]ECF5832207.1 hypothetical protein [Salmonella enterica subsp. salamae]ECF5993213.1 hypothetical protein [Salmonella enterica subsp. salamae]ECG1594290.1 hypothetical protein [Salmonella enterica subsp. salamae]ECI5035857.1 hypothetical protein [Salmonella enterica subsp. salamae]